MEGKKKSYYKDGYYYMYEAASGRDKYGKSVVVDGYRVFNVQIALELKEIDEKKERQQKEEQRRKVCEIREIVRDVLEEEGLFKIRQIVRDVLKEEEFLMDDGMDCMLQYFYTMLMCIVLIDFVLDLIVHRRANELQFVAIRLFVRLVVLGLAFGFFETTRRIKIDLKKCNRT